MQSDNPDTNAMPQWYIKVKDTVYGPYDEERLQLFASEGRLGARSLVCTEKNGLFIPAIEDEILTTFLGGPVQQKSENAQPTTAHRFVVFAKISYHSRATFMESLSSFGVAIEAMPEVWLLSAHANAATLRNAMSHVLGSEDTLFIADASKGRSAWFNVGQETDARIRQFWQDSE